MRATVSVGILLGAVVALAGDVLERSIDIHTVGEVGGREVEREAAAVDVVVGLLGDHRFVRRQVEPVAAPAVLHDGIVLERNTRISAGLEE